MTTAASLAGCDTEVFLSREPNSVCSSRWCSVQVLRGMAYLHDNCRIIHTDIKPENIMLSHSLLGRVSPSAPASPPPPPQKPLHTALMVSTMLCLHDRSWMHKIPHHNGWWSHKPLHMAPRLRGGAVSACLSKVRVCGRL